MMKSEWSRRQFLQGAGSVLTMGAAMPFGAGAQQAASAEAKEVATCITTTKDAAWQVQPLAKPGWRWDALNLNVDLSAAAQRWRGLAGASMSVGGLRS